MSRICCGTLILIAAMASASLAVEPLRMGFQSNTEPYALVPSGLRFTGTELQTLTGGLDGGYGYSGGPCSSCLQAGLCAHWTQLTWYGSWEDPHHHGGCRHAGKACHRCGY